MPTLLEIAQGFATYGDRPALVYRTGVRRRSVSYGRLDGMVRRMVGLLATLDVAEGDRVLLWGGNSPWWVAAYWGIVCRGAVVVPVDAASGSERASTVISLTAPALVIRSSSRSLAPCGVKEILLEDLDTLLDQCLPCDQWAAADPARLVELVYTSGTTGNPKGVMLNHGNLAANVAQIRRHLPAVTSEFSFLSLLPLSHLFEQTAGMLTPLACGASIVYLKAVKPSAMMEALAEESIQVVIAVPRLLLMLRNGMEERLGRRGLGPIFQRLLSLSDKLPKFISRLLFYPLRRRFGRDFRLFVSGGAPLSPQLFTFWRRLGFTLVEGYGLTECSPVLAANTLQRQEAGTVGIPLPGVDLTIRNGELLARGENVFSGYYDNPEATAAVFTADGWFRTGDLAERDPDGLLRIKGRCREMIVTGAGVNVYPDEIEELLALEPGVRDACVVGLDRGAGDEVHAVLLLSPDADAAGVVASVNARLDELHRITGWSVWPGDDFPRTTTMKIRKFMVKEALQTGRRATGEPAADRLLTAVARVTGMPAHALEDRTLLVADAGLTSIGRLELVTALEEEFRLDLDESSLGPGTTIGDLRELVRLRGGAGTSLPFRLWTASPTMVTLRRLWNGLVHSPLVGLFVKLRVEGSEHLEGVVGPLIFVANHQSYLDQPCIRQALPPQLARQTATAAWAEFFFPGDVSLSMKIWKRLCFEYCSLAVNVFPLPQSGGFRGSLHHMGRLADRGVSLLIFPEGERSPDGRLLSFKPGLAIMVEELGLPMVPVAISGVEQVLPRGARFPQRGDVVVRIGPLMECRGMSRGEIIIAAREAVRRLQEPGGRSD